MKAYLEPEEVAQLEKATDNLRDRLLVRLLSRLGCRISEALGIVVEDIDLNNHTITIQHLKMRVKLSCSECSARLGRYHAFCPVCGNKVDRAQTEQQKNYRQRVLPVDSETLKMLTEYINRGGPVLRNGKRLLFNINRHRGWQVIRDCARRANLPRLVNPETGRVHNVSPHKLRDAFAVHSVKLDDSGDGLRMLQEHLGHHNFNTTARYRKISGEEHHEWYRRLWDRETDDDVTSQT
jgi:integrase/recombinase XerD